MAIESISRRLADPASPPTYRSAPHNIEAEQALLGAILVNNEALYRVSDFLEPQHFFEPIHQQTYDVARSLIRTGKLASPVTLKTFLPAEIDIAGLMLAQYLARPQPKRPPSSTRWTMGARSTTSPSGAS